MVRKLGFVFAALCFGAASIPAAAQTVVIGMPNWPTAQVTAHIISDVLEDTLGLDTMIRPIGTVELFGAIDRGEVDVHPEVWLPNSSVPVTYFTDEAKTLTLAPPRVTATQHLCTTQATVEATGLRSVEDLANPDIAGHFDTDHDGRGEMWIGDLGWAATRIERLRARSYGYHETMLLLTMPEDQALASVDAAVATGKPVVFYCYAPHHVFALHDIVRLEEPPHDPNTWMVLTPEEDPAWLENSRAESAWEPANYHIGYASTLPEDAPNAVAFLENMALTSDDAEYMSFAVNVERRDPADVAAAWINDNAAKVKEWIE